MYEYDARQRATLLCTWFALRLAAPLGDAGGGRWFLSLHWMLLGETSSAEPRRARPSRLADILREYQGLQAGASRCGFASRLARCSNFVRRCYSRPHCPDNRMSMASHLASKAFALANRLSSQAGIAWWACTPDGERGRVSDRFRERHPVSHHRTSRTHRDGHPPRFDEGKIYHRLRLPLSPTG